MTVKPNQIISIYLSLFACLGGLLLGYDTGIIGSALLFIQPTFYLTSTLQGLTASIIIPGIMLGILFATLFADKYDRRDLIALSAFIYMLGFLLVTVATHIVMLLSGHALAGVGIGILLVIVPLYLAEIAPAKLRGSFIATFQLAITFGIFLGYGLSYWLAHYSAWRYMFACGIFCGLILFISRLYLPASLQTLSTKNISAIKNVFQRHYRRRFIIGIGLAILQQWTGINAIMYFAPQIFQSINHQTNTSVIFSGLIIAFANFIFTIIALFILDTLGRRPVLFFSLILQCLALFALGMLSHESIHAESILFILCILIYIFGFAVGLGPASWLIIAEIYPATIRSKAIGITILINNIAAFSVATLFLNLLHTLGNANTFCLFGFIALIGLLFVWYFVPETAEKNLEEIEA